MIRKEFASHIHITSSEAVASRLESDDQSMVVIFFSCGVLIRFISSGALRLIIFREVERAAPIMFRCFGWHRKGLEE